MKDRRSVHRFAFVFPGMLAAVLLAALLVPSFIASAAAPTEITIVSTNSSGAQLSGRTPAINSDGRYVAFFYNVYDYIYMKDTQTGAATIVSTNSSGGVISGSCEPSISADGRYVAFTSKSSNTQGIVYLKDTQTGNGTVVSTDSSGTVGNNLSSSPVISADGRYVAFTSSATNLAPNDTNGSDDVFLKDTQTGTLTRLTQNSDLATLPYYISMSSDGHFVAYSDGSTVWRADTSAGTRVAVGPIEGFKQHPAVSADGRYVAFSNGFQVYVEDMQTGNITSVSTDLNGTPGKDGYSYDPSISADGRLVAFRSFATNLVPNDNNGMYDIFVKDTQTGGIARFSVSSNGVEGNGNSGYPAFSGDGKFVAFESMAGNLVAGDTNNQSDAFIAPVGDITAPAITNTLPTSDQTGNSFDISADFTDSESGIDNASIHMYVNGMDVTSQATITPGHITAPVTGDGTQNVSLHVSDNAHNVGSAHWSFSTPANYYFPWFDSLFGRTWVLAAQPSSSSPAARPNVVDILMHNSGSGSMDLLTNNMFVNKGETENMPPNGRMGGPVKVVSHFGDSLISERSLFGNSFEEIWGASYYNLDSHYWWPVYDSASAGMRNWILVANPPDNNENITVRVTVHNASPDISETRDLVRGQTWTPIYAGRFGGPVEVKAWKQGSNNEDAEPRKVIASQRVLYNGAFNEMPGIAASKLSSLSIWTWYDNQYSSNWIVVSNPSTEKITAKVLVGNPYSPVFIDSSVLGPYETHSFRKPGMGGPVYAFGYKAGSSTPDANIVASQRVLMGPSFGELAGSNEYNLNYTTSTWTWYDQASSGVTNWVLIANPSADPLYAEVRIAGVTVWGGIVDAFGNKTPTFAGRMGGPVEVESWKSETDMGGHQLKQTPYIAFASQRVLWNGYFNEIVGKGQ